MFPLFLFVVGVSVAVAILPRLQLGVAGGRLARAAMWRALRIIGLGVAINLLAWWMPQAHLRFAGVLQHIGVCFRIVALFTIYSKPRTQWLAIGLLLMGYAALPWAEGSLQPVA
ncbi:MAG: heparan-alpha-glucosaminide N-acetyltransferase domain-containing protein [Rhodanobacter sp.]